MATIRYGDTSTYPHYFSFGPDGDLVTFDDDVSAADMRLEQEIDNPFAAMLSGAGTSYRLVDYRSTWIGTFPAVYNIASTQFQFSDGSQMLFANRFNGYSLVLEGGDGNDLLIGSPVWDTEPIPTLPASYGATMSPDGHMVLYTKAAAGGEPAQVFVASALPDMWSGRVSHPLDGSNTPNGDSWGITLSAHGRAAIYMTDAANIGGATPYTKIVSVDMKYPVVPYVVNHAVDGGAANGDSSSAQITSDGSSVVYRSEASNLVNGDTNGKADIFVARAGTTTLASVSSSEAQANGHSWEPSISGDGRYVAFRSAATNLVTGDTNGADDIFLRDTVAGTTTLISRGTSHGSYDPAISDNGKYVVFYSNDDLGLTGDGSGRPLHLFVASTARPDRVELASADADGTPREIIVVADDDPSSYGVSPSISGDGRYVVFASRTPLLVPDDTDNVQDVFVKDMHTGAVARLETGDGGASVSASISDDGRKISYSHSQGTQAPWEVQVVDNPLLHAVLAGGDGDDSYQIARADDVVVEAEDGGDDRVVSSVSYRLPDHVETLVLRGNARNATGNDEANTLTGNAARNRLDGGDGADEMRGGAGNDNYVVDDAGDRVRESRNGGHDTVTSSVSHTLAANVEALKLSGSADLRGSGNGSDNIVTGNRGDNLLDGKAGSDVLTGAGGVDLFLLRNAAGSDTITDFDSGREHIRIGAVALGIGDGDGRLDGAAARGGPGRYSVQSELVLFRADTDGDLDARDAAAAIGSAGSAFDDGDRRVFVVDNGQDSAVYLFTSDGADRRVSAGELHLLALVQDTETTLGDYLFGA